MGSVISLPLVVDRVTIPEYFSPSQLASGEKCLLRAVLGSMYSGVPTLNAHPAAETGRVFHRLLELAARGAIQRGGSLHEDVCRALDEILAETRARLSRDPVTDGYADLARTVSPLLWFQKRSTVTNIAARLLQAASRKPSGGGSGGSAVPSYATLPSAGEWPEVKIVAPRLRLAGRIDLLEKHPGAVTIRDLKSGRIEDRDGQLLAHIDLQLRLYGIMALDLEPHSTVKLIVDAGKEQEVPFDDEIAEATLNWVADLVNRLPPQSERPAYELARPGEPCRYCPYRHVCEAYLEAAPIFWRNGCVDRMPLDIWGWVESISPRPGGVVDIALRDEAGRRVKAFGVGMVRVSDVREGDRLYFFGLQGRPQIDREGLWRQPLNFYEVSDDDPRDRAWSLEVFRQNPSDNRRD